MGKPSTLSISRSKGDEPRLRTRGTKIKKARDKSRALIKKGDEPSLRTRRTKTKNPYSFL
jgi:hypothetical protein